MSCAEPGKAKFSRNFFIGLNWFRKKILILLLNRKVNFYLFAFLTLTNGSKVMTRFSRVGFKMRKIYSLAKIIKINISVLELSIQPTRLKLGLSIARSGFGKHLLNDKCYCQAQIQARA